MKSPKFWDIILIIELIIAFVVATVHPDAEYKAGILLLILSLLFALCIREDA